MPLTSLSIHKQDNCVIIRNKVAVIKNIICESQKHPKFLVVKEFLYMSNFFDLPLPSTDLMIYYVMDLSLQYTVYSIENVLCKCVLVPFHEGFISMPLVHTL